MRLWLSRSLPLLLVLPCFLCCANGGGPPDAPFDGEVVIGDGAPKDAEPLHVDADAQDTSFVEAGSGDATDLGDAGDGSFGDVDPGLDAEAPDAAVDCDQLPEITLSATAAIDGLSTWQGRVIDIVGTATVSGRTCTERACPPESPCCNRCTAQVVIDHHLPLAGGPCSGQVGCAGDECQLVCTPLILGGRERFRGVLHAGPPRLELFRVVP